MNAVAPLWASVHDIGGTASDAEKEEALEFASFILWSLSGRMYQGETTVREAYDTRSTLAYGAQVYPVFFDGVPYNLSSCSDCPCSLCGVFHRTRLRGYPVRRILRVWVNGVELHPSQWVLLDYAVLGLRGASACNARCITVEYIYGSGIPAGGKMAAVKLASQLLLSSQGAPCELPARVTSVTRQGMSFTLLDPQDFLEKGRTGIYEIDLMLSAVNPAGALKRPRVFSPDIRRAEVQVPSLVDPPNWVPMQFGDQIVYYGAESVWSIPATELQSDTSTLPKLRTFLANGLRVRAQWALGKDGKHAELVIDDTTTRLMDDGMGYVIKDLKDDVVFTGRIHVL